LWDQPPGPQTLKKLAIPPASFFSFSTRDRFLPVRARDQPDAVVERPRVSYVHQRAPIQGERR